MVYTDSFEIETQGRTDIIDITGYVQETAHKSRLTNGLLNVSIAGSTAAITTVEFERGLARDLPELFEKLVPSNRPYHHDETWGDGNGYAHLRASLICSSRTFPLVEGKVVLGTWQQIVFIDFDNRARKRRVLVQIVGE
jgi:secondary thiamine-phosphate synthase enzyme